MQRERVLLTRYLVSFGTLLGASHARNNVPQRLQLFAPELNLSLLLIGSLLDNRDGPGGGIGRRRFCRRRKSILALGITSALGARYRWLFAQYANPKSAMAHADEMTTHTVNSLS